MHTNETMKKVSDANVLLYICKRFLQKNPSQRSREKHSPTNTCKLLGPHHQQTVLKSLWRTENTGLTYTTLHDSFDEYSDDSESQARGLQANQRDSNSQGIASIYDSGLSRQLGCCSIVLALILHGPWTSTCCDFDLAISTHTLGMKLGRGLLRWKV